MYKLHQLIYTGTIAKTQLLTKYFEAFRSGPFDLLAFLEKDGELLLTGEVLERLIDVVVELVIL
jgi:hypothetical protein